MTFDKSRVYTMLNADEAPIGSYGYFADTVYQLRKAVEDEEKISYKQLEGIENEYSYNRFISGPYGSNLFYLVEENA